ncbi:MAG: GAF domain-containing protein [Anaerolineae bacterium]|nr:GAF domain-containing protein [Anaerolineae bacterium]
MDGGRHRPDLGSDAPKEHVPWATSAQRQAALLRLSAELAASLDEQAVCERVAQGLREELGYDFVAVFLLDEATRERVLISYVGYEQLPPRLAPGQGVSERSLLTGRLHYSPDVTLEPSYYGGLEGAEVDVPILIEGRSLGVLAVGSRQRGAFDQEDFEMLTAAAQQVGLAIEKARLLAAERQRADELDALRQTMAEITANLELESLLQAIVERAAGLLGGGRAELGLYDEAAQEIRIVVSHNLERDSVGTRLQLGEGAMGRVAQTREPLIVADYQSWPGRARAYDDIEMHASLTVPLMVGARLVGTIGVAARDAHRRFGAADLRLLASFAQQAAVAIENARLYGEAERRVAELTALTEVGKALSSTLRIEALLPLIYEQTRRVMYAEHMLIMLRDPEAETFECAFSNRPDDIPPGSRYPVDTGVTGYVLKNRQSVLLGHDVMEGLQALGIPLVGTLPASFLAVPMLIGERAIGVIIVQHYSIPDVHDQTHQLLLETIASQAAVAVENARLYDRAQREIDERRRVEAELRAYQERLEELVAERTARLRQSEERYRSLFEGIPLGLYRTTPSGQMLTINPAMVEMLGYPSREALLATNATDLYLDPKDRQMLRDRVEEAGILRDFETRLRRRDGAIIWVNLTLRAARDAQGFPAYYEGSLEDITERKQAEQALQEYQQHLEELVEERTARLRQSEERYRTLFDGVPVGLYRTTPDGHVRDFNLAAVQMLGYPDRETVLSESVGHVWVDPKMRELWQRLMAREGVVRNFEMQLRRVDGTAIWVSDTARAVRDQAGQVLYYEGSLEDITERKRAEEELRRAKEDAEAANRAKSIFLANMSHELRTPLNAILGFAQLLRQEPSLTSDQRENLGIINSSGEHLLRLINQVLEMSKIEAGRATLEVNGFDLHQMLADLQAMFALRAEDKGVNLDFERSSRVPRLVRTDEGKLKQVLINLIDNAIKFTAQGDVTVRGDADEAPLGASGSIRLRFEVRDTGPGMAPDELDRLFEPFVQASSGLASQEGTGLGLAISLQFVQLMDGHLTVTSEPGRGSTFSLDILAELDQALGPEIDQTPARIVGLEPGQPVYRTLVVEDREANRQLLAKLLTSLDSPPQGLEVRTARNGKEAVELWQKWRPHLIWMDMRMPVMDGYEATRRIRSGPGGEETIIVALTASAFEEDARRILKGGCDDVVRKPFRAEEIYAMLSRHLGLRFTSESAPAESEGGPGLAREGGPGPEALAARPAAWRSALRAAVVAAEWDRIQDLIAEVHGSDAALAEGLSRLAQEFEYGKLLGWLDEAEQRAES